MGRFEALCQIVRPVFSRSCVRISEQGVSYAIAKKHHQDWHVASTWQGSWEGFPTSLVKKDRLSAYSKKPTHRNLLLLAPQEYQLMRIHIDDNSIKGQMQEIETITGLMADSFIWDSVVPFGGESGEYLVAVVEKDILYSRLKLLKKHHLPCHAVTVPELALAGFLPYLPATDILFVMRMGKDPVIWRAVLWTQLQLQATMDLPFDEVENAWSDLHDMILDMVREFRPLAPETGWTLAVVSDQVTEAKKIMEQLELLSWPVPLVNCCALSCVPEQQESCDPEAIHINIAGLGYYAVACS